MWSAETTVKADGIWASEKALGNIRLWTNKWQEGSGGSWGGGGGDHIHIYIYVCVCVCAHESVCGVLWRGDEQLLRCLVLGSFVCRRQSVG